MSDPTQTPPIMVNGSPTQVQLEALLRQVITVLGTIAGMAGYAGIAGKLNALLLIIGPIASVVAIVWGQVRTATEAKKSKAMAEQLPDSVATTR